MEIRKIEIILENCETIMVDRKYIGDFNVENIKKSINRSACNSIGSSLSCDMFTISIHRDMSQCNKESWLFGETDKERNPIQRLNTYNDITAINVYYENDTEEYIFVSWDGDNDFYNKYQSSYINEFGDLYIVVDKNNKYYDVFDMKEINNNDEVDFTWEMYK